MDLSLTELTRTPALPVLVALIAAFAVFLTSFRLAARARETTIEGRAGWLLLASVAAGGGLWACSTLLLTTMAAPAEIRANLLMSGLFVAIGTAFAGFVIQGRRAVGVRAFLAGITTALGTVTVAAIGLQALALEPAVSISTPWAAWSLLFVSLAAGAAHRIAASPSVHAADWAAGLMAPAIVLSSLALLVSPHARAGFRFETDGGTIGPLSAVVLVAIVVFLVVATGMATALIHRDAEFVSQARLKRLADASVEGLAVVDGTRVVEINRTLLELIGVDRDAILGEPFVGHRLQVDALGRDGDRFVEGHVLASDGRLVPVEVVARPIDYDGRQLRVLAVRDLSDRRDAELRIRFLAEHDILTGLANRAAFQRELQRRCDGLADGTPGFAVVAIDLDRFKEANDVLGGKTGDELLATVGGRLRSTLPDDAFAARVGGDEFVALVPDHGGVHGLGALAERLVDILSAPIDCGGRSLRLGASVGIALAPADGGEPELLVARAGLALDRAKGEGRGRSCFFEPAMDEETRRRRALMFDFRAAVDAGDLQLAYQPLADLGSNGVTGFEALVRWEHPVHGAISPAIFLSIAEECGLSARIGDFVLRTALAEAASWTRPLRVAVNLAPEQVLDPDLPDRVRAALVASGVSPARLELEVTEAALIQNPQRALDVLRRLKALGVAVAMDDFGTGLSSLAMLKAFPFDKLKMDRSFVDRVGHNDQAASMVRGVLGLTRSLDIRVVAEGVETEAQMVFLSGESCDEVQGFMIGLPRPIADYAHLTGAASGPPPAAPARRRVAQQQRRRA